MVDVLEPNAVVVSDGTTTLRLPITGGVRPTWAAGFPGKVVTGDYSRDTEPIASSHIFGDFSGGLLIYRMDPKTQADRLWYSTLETRFQRQTTLPPLATATQPSGVTTAVVSAGTQYDLSGTPRLYAAWSSTIKLWNNAAAAWETPGGYTAGSHDLTGSATDAATIRLGTTEWLVFCDGSKLTKYDGTTWTRVSGDDSSIPKAKYLTVWDDRLWAITGQNKLWSTTDLSTWTAAQAIPLQADAVTHLFTFFNQANDEWLHAATKDGLWFYDPDQLHWYRTRLRYPRHRAGGAGATEHKGDLYLSAGTTVYRFTGSVVQNVGLDRDFGLERSFRGDINTLTDGFNWLVAGINTDQTAGANPATTLTGTVATTSTSTTLTGTSTLFLSELAVGNFIRVNGTVKRVTAIATNLSLTVDTAYGSSVSGLAALRVSGVPYGGVSTGWISPALARQASTAALFAFDGTAWHTLWTQAVAGTGVTWCQLLTADNVARLWWAAEHSVYYMSVPSGIFNPRELPDWEYAATGTLITPIFDKGWSEIPALLLGVDLKIENLSATETADVLYAYDDPDTFYPLVTVTSTNAPDGTLSVDFDSVPANADGRGLEAKDIRVKVELSRGSDATKSPRLIYLTLRYLVRRPARYGYQFTTDFGESYEGRTAEELASSLKDLLEENKRLSFTFWRDGQELVTRKVVMSDENGIVNTGTDTRSRWTVTLVEV